MLISFCLCQGGSALAGHKYHIVFVPKYRYKVFTKEIKEAVRDELRKLCAWLGVGILEGHVRSDHIHLCLSIPPKYSISEIAATLKGKVAIRMFNRYLKIRKNYCGNHF
jgi:putative transposase